MADYVKFPTWLTGLFIGLLILFPGTASAAFGVDKTRLEIQAFLKSSDYEFAPQSADKAQAYIGAAMLAQEQRDELATTQSLDMARQKLSEARRLSGDFRGKYSGLLRLRTAAMEIDAGTRKNPGEAALHKMIRSIETGQLNQVEQFRKEADRQYRGLISSGLPGLVQETARLIGRASAAGAKNYTPRTYNAAKEWLNDADAYLDGIGRAPDHPRRGIALAAAARALALQIKQFRRDSGSHEKLILAARSERLRIAEKLGIKNTPENPLADIDIKTILASIDQKRLQQTDSVKLHRAEISGLKKQYERKLEAGLLNQRSTLLQQQRDQVSGLKDAFRAKLERETFDQSRQKKLQKTFHNHEVDIFPNLDGSILIRLSTLKFTSGGSGINKNYYDMLARLKRALDVYADRKVHIEGHSDNQGDARGNRTLSLKRAESVRDFLISTGVNANRLKTLGFGEVRPIASNDYKKGREMNRRIDVIIQPPSP